MKKLTIVLVVVLVTSLVSCQQMKGQNNYKQLRAKRAAEWKGKLNPEQYQVMVEEGTETPFKNDYWNNHQKGVYVSAATGEVLFSSADKFESGTGWPSFTKAVNPDKVAFVTDYSYGMKRTEVVEKSTGLHLGHLFDDGPEDRGGKRYCMNSAALRFVKQ